MSYKNCKEVEFGFVYGKMQVTRLCVDKTDGHASIAIDPVGTERCGICVHVSADGELRVFDADGEWTSNTFTSQSDLEGSECER